MEYLPCHRSSDRRHLHRRIFMKTLSFRSAEIHSIHVERPRRMMLEDGYFCMEIAWRRGTRRGVLGGFPFSQNFQIPGSAINGIRFVGSSHWKIPRKSGKSKKVGPFSRLEFPKGISRSIYSFLVICTSSRSTVRKSVGHCDVPGFTTKWNNAFTNRKFHFCSHRNFPVFFPNGKRPLYRLPAWLASHTDVLLADKSLFVRVFRAPRLLRACLCSPEKREPITCPLGYQRQYGRPQKGKEKEGKGRGDANYKTTFFFPFSRFCGNPNPIMAKFQAVLTRIQSFSMC